MIKNGYYYPDYLWKKTCHMNEITGEAEGDCMHGFAVGNRRAGKSVGVGIFAFADFLLFGYQTVLIRRYKDDFQKKKAMEKFWLKSWPYVHEFPNIVKGDVKLQEIYPLELVENFDWENHTLEFVDNHAIVDGKPFSFPCALNKYNDFKQDNFSNVHKLIYDEYVPEKDTERLKDEVEAMYIVFDTAARGREGALDTTSIIYISNSITNVNDFYVELGIDRELRYDAEGNLETKRLYRPESGYVWEGVNNEVASEEMLNSKAARGMRGTIGQKYLNYSQGNMIKDDESFVERMDGDFRYLMNFRYDNKLYALKLHLDDGNYYFTDQGIDKKRETIALQREDHTLNTVLISTFLRERLGIVKSFYGIGRMRFNSMRSKKIFIEMYRYL